MAFLKIRLSKPRAVLLVIPSFLFGLSCLLIGAAEFRHPDVPPEYLAVHPWTGTMECIVAVAIGLVFLFVGVATVRGSLLDRQGVLDAKQAETFTRGPWLH